MDIALSIRSQMLATLMAALDTDSVQAAGAVVKGRLLNIEDNGQAVLLVKGQPLNVNFGPQALAQGLVSLNPGSMVSLRIDGFTAEGQARASLLPADAGQQEMIARSASGQAASSVAQDSAASPGPTLALTRATLAQGMARASAGQQELGPLLANLEAMVAPEALGGSAGMSAGKSGEARLPSPVPLPASVATAAAMLLGLRYDADTPGLPPDARAAALRRAIAGSGVTHEARLASGTLPDLAIAAGDLKSVLTLLRSATAEMRSQPSTAAGVTVQEQAQQATSPAMIQRPPPHRDAMPVGQPPAEPDIAALGNTAQEVAAALTRQADGALDRVRMLQGASLPASLPPEMRAGGPDATQNQRWLMELPMVVDGRSHVLPLRIEREPERHSQAGREGALWRVRFALDGEPLGALHAIITWRMRQLGIQIWAEREETRNVLRLSAHQLHRSFDEALFDAVEIDIHAGRPAEPKPARGVLLDRIS